MPGVLICYAASADMYLPMLQKRLPLPSSKYNLGCHISLYVIDISVKPKKV
jgi:hypothetical protein